MQIFKIRNNVGLFSTGGARPRFTKIGKTWANIGHVRNHLNCKRGWPEYKDCVLVVLEVIENEVDAISVNDLIQEGKDRAAERDAKAKERYRKFREELERQQYEKLKKQFGG